MPPSRVIPKACLISVFISGGTLVPNRMEDLQTFSCCREERQYVLMIFMSFVHCEASALQRKRLSSANKIWEIGGSLMRFEACDHAFSLCSLDLRDKGFCENGEEER